MAIDLTVRHLVASRLDALEFESKHVDLATYYGARYAAMAAAFGVDDTIRDRAGLHVLAGACERAIRDLRSPFSGFLEAPQAIADLSRVHGPVINDTVTATRESILDLLVDVTCRRFGLPADRTVPLHTLQDHGFDIEAHAPDPIDYW